jgi:hypothetical protein
MRGEEVRKATPRVVTMVLFAPVVNFLRKKANMGLFRASKHPRHLSALRRRLWSSEFRRAITHGPTRTFASHTDCTIVDETDSKVSDDGLAMLEEYVRWLQVEMIDRWLVRVRMRYPGDDLLKETKASTGVSENRHFLERSLSAVFRNQEGLAALGQAVFDHLQNIRVVKSHTRLNLTFEVLHPLRIFQPFQDVQLWVGPTRTTNHKSVALFSLIRLLTSSH